MGKRLFSSFLTVLVLLGVLFVFMFLSSELVDAWTTTVNTPIDDGLLTGTDFEFDATIGEGSNVSNCSWYYSSDASTWTIFNSTTNVSKYHITLPTNDTATHFNVTFDTNDISDLENYYINVSCYKNVAGNVGVCSDITTASVDVDNVVPTISAITLPKYTNLFITNPIEIECIGSDPSTWKTTIKITKPSGRTVEKIVGVGRTVEFKNTDTNEAGLYLVDCNVFAPYGVNSTVSAAQKSFRVFYEDIFTEEEAEEKPIAKLDISTTEVYTGTISGKQGESKTFTLDSVTVHTLEFVEVTFTSATLKINPEITLDVGKYKNADLDGDGKDDIKVTLESIEGDLAKVEITNLVKLEEKVKEEREAGLQKVEEKPSRAGLWLTILVILVVIVVGYYLLKKRKGKKGQVKFSKQDIGL